MNETLKLEGGCLCGAIRYRATGRPYHLTHCHCALCRRASGAPFVTWFSVPSADFLVAQGEPARYRSSPGAVRSFCGQCGTQLTFQRDALPGEIDVTIGSLDDPGMLTPEDHTYVRSRLRWIVTNDGLPEHTAARENPGERGADRG